MTVLHNTLTITSVRFHGLDNLNLPFTAFELVDGVSNGGADNDDKYFVKSVTGLEPPDREIAISRTASGGHFQGATMADREVVALIGLNPDEDAGETVKMLREELYTLVHTGYDPKVMIQLMEGPVAVAQVAAYVVKFEASIFEANPAVQITFSCLNPTFKSLTMKSYPPADLSETAPDIYNRGTAEAGFKFAVKFTGTKNGWWIKQVENRRIGMTFDMEFHDGDVLAVSTVPGQRYVHWNKHRGKVKNMLKILTNDSEWVMLHPGHNNFVVPKKTTLWNWKGQLSFTPEYLGV